MKKRTYVSPMRAAAVAETRASLINAAVRLLSEHSDFTGFSLEAVARKAKVTRLTVYNQFGSRRGLLEAVLDDLAEKGGLGSLPDVLNSSDPAERLDELIEIFCRFWASAPVVGKLNEAVAIDAEFGEAVVERNERRRTILSSLVQELSAGRNIRKQQRQDATDVIFGLTSYSVFKAISSHRSESAACKLLKRTCASALESLLLKPCS